MGWEVDREPVGQEEGLSSQAGVRKILLCV